MATVLSPSHTFERDPSNKETHMQASPRATPSTLHLVIVGAGLCGLSTAISTRLEGHSVTILESAHELTEVGAGIGLTPNSVRLFHRWGIYDELARAATPPDTMSVYRYDGTMLLAQVERYQEKLMGRYGAPFWGIHRADLHGALANRAEELGVVVRLSARAVHIDFDQPSVTIESGESISGDVILGADGLWSTTRDLFLGRPTPPKPTGDIAYRIVLRRDEISDAELKDWAARPASRFWAGPHSHAAAYAIGGGEVLNLVLLCPDDLEEDVRRAEGNTEEMKERFDGWDPMWGSLSLVRLPLKLGVGMLTCYGGQLEEAPRAGKKGG
jgi:salicylate hydroxylase